MSVDKLLDLSLKDQCIIDYLLSDEKIKKRIRNKISFGGN